MAIRITNIQPKATVWPTDKVLAHSSIQIFKWINDLTRNEGISDLELMFDWVVNRGGKAYIRKSNGDEIPVFGAVSPSGQKYLRCLLKDGNWSDDLLDLPAM